MPLGAGSSQPSAVLPAGASARPLRSFCCPPGQLGRQRPNPTWAGGFSAGLAAEQPEAAGTAERRGAVGESQGALPGSVAAEKNRLLSLSPPSQNFETNNPGNAAGIHYSTFFVFSGPRLAVS